MHVIQIAKLVFQPDNNVQAVQILNICTLITNVTPFVLMDFLILLILLIKEYVHLVMCLA